MREREDGGDETSFLSDCMREKEEARDDGKEALAPTEERKHTQGRSKGVKRVKHREEGKRRQEAANAHPHFLHCVRCASGV